MCLLAPISALDLPKLRTEFPLLWNVQISDECCDAQNKGIDRHFFCKSSYFLQSREDCSAQNRALVTNPGCYSAFGDEDSLASAPRQKSAGCHFPILQQVGTLTFPAEFHSGQTRLSQEETWMSKKSKLAEAQERIADVAKVAGAGAKDIASDALGAAAAAAAGVVFQRVSETIARSQEKVDQAVPADRPAMAESLGTPQRRRTAKSRSVLRKAPSKPRKSRAAKNKKRAAANKKTLKKVASQKGLRRRSGK
jgi:hypothetical protein